MLTLRSITEHAYTSKAYVLKWQDVWWILLFYSNPQGKKSLPSRPRVCCWLSFQLGPSGKKSSVMLTSEIMLTFFCLFIGQFVRKRCKQACSWATGLPHSCTGNHSFFPWMGCESVTRSRLQMAGNTCICFDILTNEYWKVTTNLCPSNPSEHIRGL